MVLLVNKGQFKGEAVKGAVSRSFGQTSKH